MNEPRRDPATKATNGGPLSYPKGRVAGAVDGLAVPAVVADLTAAGFAAGEIGVLIGEADARRFHDAGNPPGPWGLAKRVALSMGGDLDLIHQAEAELLAGDALVDVAVDGDDAQLRARDILLRHGGHFINHFKRWTIESLD